MASQQTVNSAGSVTTWTAFVSHCRGCSLTFRVSVEAIEHTRAEDGAEGAADSDAQVANRIEYCLLCASGTVAFGEKVLELGWSSPFRYSARPEDGGWSVFYDDPEADLAAVRVRGQFPGEPEAREYAEVIGGTWHFCPPAGAWLTLHQASLWAAGGARPASAPDLEEAERFTPQDDETRFWIRTAWPGTASAR